MKTYLVGGAVRDQLLQHPYSEKDWVVVGATPEQMLALGFQAVGKDFPVFLHPQTKEEYALARTERKSGPGYTGFECHADPGVSLEEDLLRRDLTINAIAQDENGRLIDPYHGREDLQAKCLRHVSPAFVEDPLRVLRVARFYARYAHLGFTVAAETVDLMRRIADSGELETLSAERVWKEFEKALGETSPTAFFEVMNQCHALQAIMPELCAVPEKNLAALQSSATADLPVTARFALLFFNLAETEATRFCTRIKVPNAYRKLAMLVSRLGNIICDGDNNDETLLAIIEQADAFRNPQRFALLLDCCRHLCPGTTTPDLLQAAVEACASVDAKSIAAQGLEGKAIARELHRQRLQAISQLRNSP